MPQRDGFDLIGQVLASVWSAEKLPAVAISAFAREQDQQQALAAGFQLHFGQPRDLTALLLQIAGLLAGASGQTPNASPSTAAPCRPLPVNARRSRVPQSRLASGASAGPARTSPAGPKRDP